MKPDAKPPGEAGSRLQPELCFSAPDATVEDDEAVLLVDFLPPLVASSDIATLTRQLNDLASPHKLADVILPHDESGVTLGFAALKFADKRDAATVLRTLKGWRARAHTFPSLVSLTNCDVPAPQQNRVCCDA